MTLAQIHSLAGTNRRMEAGEGSGDQGGYTDAAMFASMKIAG